MSAYSLTHLADRTLLRDLVTLVVRDRATTAAMLAHVAEVDARRLYLPASYPSMHAYCVQELRLSEDSARKRIHAARAARRVPAVFVAVAEGRLHSSAVVQLAPYLTPENADTLLVAATHKTKSEVEQLIAEHFPRLDVPEMVQVIPEPPSRERAPGRVDLRGPKPAEAPRRPSPVAPLSPERFALQLTIGKATHEKLMHARALLSHSNPSGDVALVLDRALDTLIEQLEKRKFGATSKPQEKRRATANPRHIPPHVRRAVRERDLEQCTFVSETGRRCSERSFLEFDHVEPVARGGRATIEGIRLRCRAHNQYEAERTFGVGFMEEKRERARRGSKEEEMRVVDGQVRDVMAGLRKLGVRAADARCAAEYSRSLAEASLEERMRCALMFLCPRVGRSGPSVGMPA